MDVKKKLFSLFQKIFGISYSLEEALSFNQISKEKKENKEIGSINTLYKGSKEYFGNQSLYKILLSKEKEKSLSAFFFKNSSQESPVLFSKVHEIGKNKIIEEEYYFDCQEKRKRRQMYERDGIYEVHWYYKTGEIEKIQIFQKNSFSSYEEFQYYRIGQLKERKRYKDGRLVGRIEHFYEDGRISYRGYRSIRGTLEGIFEVYHSVGTLWKEFHYENDKLMGIYREYYENGQIKIIKLFWENECLQIIARFDRQGNLE
ncbi:hypothetical protein IX329_001018 [Fusobacterium necrophorum]|nr:hypothetical protein [Fusobacterium necrophorum]MBR8733444.1 hypothetical protein [Fusobacterium necrophorum]MBR8789621.1 hypothetical protein [Fusobacterium necrophorum]